MLKEVFTKVLFIGALFGTSLMAGTFESSFTTHSLVAIEGGYSRINVENDDSPVYKEKLSFSNIGLKIGAETDEYRMFLSTRYYSLESLQYIYTYGIEFHQKYLISSMMNFFGGINGGSSYINYEDEVGFKRIISKPYYGAESGINVNLDEFLDIELGVRVTKLMDASNTRNSITYIFDNLISGYASIIMKYTMD